MTGAEIADCLERVSALAQALPAVQQERMGSHAKFTVRKKTFLYFLNDHHGDGIVGINCKVPPGENAALIAAQPRRFYMPAYVGARGWVGLRLDAGRISWKEVAELIEGSHRAVAGPRVPASTRQS